MDLSKPIDQMYLKDIYRTFYPTEEYTFSRTHRTVSMTDHMSGLKTSPNKFEKIGIIPCIFSEHNGMKPEMSKSNKMEIHKYMENK